MSAKVDGNSTGPERDLYPSCRRRLIRSRGVDRVGAQLERTRRSAVPKAQTRQVHPFTGIRAPEIRLLIVVSLLISAAVFVSSRVQTPPLVHSIALFGHLASLVVGFGSVVGVDYFGLLWFLRRIPLDTMLRQADRMSPLIWLGLGGLVVTGAFMEPQLGAPLTLIKMGCVVGVGIVGVLALSTKRTMMRQMPRVTASVLIRGLFLAAMSQALWWSTVLIGFLNMTSTS
jgi:hypothetical protein